MKNYERKKNYKRDTTARDGRQQLLPWSPSLTISTNEAAQRLGVSYDTVRDMCKTGELQGWPIRPKVKGSPYRVSKDSLELFIERKMARYDLDDPELQRRLERRGVGQPTLQTAPSPPRLQKAWTPTRLEKPSTPPGTRERRDLQ